MIGDLTGAIVDYSNAIQINTNNIQAYLNRGLLYQKVKRKWAAIKDFNAARSINTAYTISFLAGQAIKSFSIIRPSPFLMLQVFVSTVDENNVSKHTRDEDSDYLNDLPKAFLMLFANQSHWHKSRQKRSASNSKYLDSLLLNTLNTDDIGLYNIPKANIPIWKTKRFLAPNAAHISFANNVSGSINRESK